MLIPVTLGQERQELGIWVRFPCYPTWALVSRVPPAPLLEISLQSWVPLLGSSLLGPLIQTWNFPSWLTLSTYVSPNYVHSL